MCFVCKYDLTKRGWFEMEDHKFEVYYTVRLFLYVCQRENGDNIEGLRVLSGRIYIM